MTDSQWEMFFALLGEIVHMPASPGTPREKADTVKAEAATNGSRGDLREFLSWFKDDE